MRRLYSSYVEEGWIRFLFGIKPVSSFQFLQTFASRQLPFHKLQQYYSAYTTTIEYHQRLIRKTLENNYIAMSCNRFSSRSGKKAGL